MEGVSKVTLEANGQKITGFKGIKLPEEAYREQEETMDGVVQFEVGQNLSPLDVDYIIPKNRPQFDWKSMVAGTLTVDFKNGTRKVYTGVSLLKKGEISLDGKVAVQTISLGAEEVDG